MPVPRRKPPAGGGEDGGEGIVVCIRLRGRGGEVEVDMVDPRAGNRRFVVGRAPLWRSMEGLV